MYQSGYFDDSAVQTYQGSHNGGTLTTRVADSLNRHKRDSVKMRIFSWSKTIIVNDAKLQKQINERLYGKSPEPVPDTATTERLMPGYKVILLNIF